MTSKAASNSNNQFEGIVHRLADSDGGRLRSDALRLGEHRKDLIDQIRSTRQQLLFVRQSEYQPIVIGHESFDPSEAARKVASQTDLYSWIPAPVTLGALLPLSDIELSDLYRTNGTVTTADEAELAFPLPDANVLPGPQGFAAIASERESLSSTDRTLGAEYWEPLRGDENVATLEVLITEAERAIEAIGSGERWRLEIIAAGQRGGPHQAPWVSLINLIEQANREAAEAQETLFRYGPAVTADSNLDEAQQTVAEIIRHLAAKGSLNTLNLLMHPSWKRLLATMRVAGTEPRLPEHFEALRVLIELEQRRRELIGRWDRQMVVLGVPPLTRQGDPPERVAEQWIGHIGECLAWPAETWNPVELKLRTVGFRWMAFLSAQPVNPAPAGDLLRLRDAIAGQLPLVFAARLRAIRWLAIQRKLDEVRHQLANSCVGDAAASVVRHLLEAVVRLDPHAYAAHFGRLVELHVRRRELERRRNLLVRLSAVAPGWAGAIQNRDGLHGAATPPPDGRRAWLWRQLHDELERRAALSLRDLERRLETLTVELRATSAELIDRRAWSEQAERVSLRQRQALIGWADTVRRIGRGTGRRAPQLRLEAIRLMSDCRSAVPVWIMPLARVVEQFDPRQARFDVVIIDEASQSDVMALVACYLGRKVVVVGDHEQVSPLAVGQDLDLVQRLIATHLEDIPNSHLYDGRMSVYDLGRQAFGQTIVLVEHFRCVPEIIQFSNGLSYNWRIRPLRDGSNVGLRPHVVPFRVQATRYGRDVNYDEAWAVASLIASAVEQPEYAGKTFGVITLVGETQALEIDRLLRQHVPATAIDQRRIVCGNAAQFQGDERDVMFLSMVDIPEGAPLPLRQDDRFKQGYNVAASRARDQMWVVHSLHPQLDLKPGDLRRELIEHAEDPFAKVRALEQVERRSESELERQVLRYLVHANHRVVAQWQVGHYRIDLVVEGGGKRLAVECDGDRWHPPEKLAEDLERQAILERLGWTFVRVRGTEFFRHPDRALQPVFEMLERLEISPSGSAPALEQPAHSSALLDRLVGRANELKDAWLADPAAHTVTEALTSGSASSTATTATELSHEEQRILEAVRLAGRSVGKAEILGRTGLPESSWSSAIASLLARGLVTQEGTRRGATYRAVMAGKDTDKQDAEPRN